MDIDMIKMNKEKKRGTPPPAYVEEVVCTGTKEKKTPP